jgi:hypothetical protein
MALSKKTRFEVFKRDGFACQYCGRNSETVVLEVDHIDPKANGGSDDSINLITACFDCNRGKSDRKLGDVHPRPDADLKYLAAQQEIAEARRYLDTQWEMEQLRTEMVGRLQDVWEKYIDDAWVPVEKTLRNWIARYSPEDIEYAFRYTGTAYRKGKFGSRASEWACKNAIKYAGAIMRNVVQERGNNAQTTG